MSSIVAGPLIGRPVIIARYDRRIVAVPLVRRAVIVIDTASSIIISAVIRAVPAMGAATSTVAVTAIIAATPAMATAAGTASSAGPAVPAMCFRQARAEELAGQHQRRAQCEDESEAGSAGGENCLVKNSHELSPSIETQRRH